MDHPTQPANPANPAYPVMEVIRQRWSPRAFAETPVEREKLLSILEAARWAASSFNEQPWRFIIATQDQPDHFQQALDCLVEFNQSWAKNAPVLMLSMTRKQFSKNEKFNRVHQHDLGLAMAHLTLQATELGLVVHQMAGIEPEAVRESFQVPDVFEPQTAAAIGYAGDPSQLPEQLQEQERAPRQRMPLSQFVFDEAFGEPAEIVT